MIEDTRGSRTNTLPSRWTHRRDRRMSLTRVLLRLHPASFREHWGPALEADTRADGAKPWLNLLASAVDMWLHPVVWPAESSSRRRQRAATMAFTIALTIWFVGRATAANDSLLSRHAHPAWNLTNCAELMALGMLLILPLPRLTWRALTALLRKSLLSLTVPLAIGIGGLVFVHSTHPAAMSTPRLLATACYWLTLALGEIQVVRVICSVDSTMATPPGPARLRLGIGILSIGGALAVGVYLSSVVTRSGFDGQSAAGGAGLALLTCMFFSVLRDLSYC